MLNDNEGQESYGEDQGGARSQSPSVKSGNEEMDVVHTLNPKDSGMSPKIAIKTS